MKYIPENEELKAFKEKHLTIEGELEIAAPGDYVLLLHGYSVLPPSPIERHILIKNIDKHLEGLTDPKVIRGNQKAIRKNEKVKKQLEREIEMNSIQASVTVVPQNTSPRVRLFIK